MKYYDLILVATLVPVIAVSASNAHAAKNTLTDLKWQFAYDEAGLITKIVDPGSRETKFFYDFDKTTGFINRLTRELPDGTTVIHEFDRFERCVKMTDSGGTTHYEYDKNDHLTNVRRDGSLPLSYTYDTMDRLESQSLGQGLTVRYAYDFLGRLSKIETPAGNISYEYWTGHGIVTRTLPNGFQTQWEYLPDGALKSITHVSRNNWVLSKFTYAYRPDGLMQAVKEWTPRGEKIVQYEYDNVQRLSTVVDSSGQKIQYQYDKLGNRLVSIVNGKGISSTYNWAGQVTSHNGLACTHDAAGNLTAYGGKNGDRLFEYNAVNLLKTVTKEGVKVEYAYDGDGYLVARTVGGKTTSFVPDPLANIWCPLLATDANGKQTFYVWDEAAPLMAISGKNVKFFLHDHLVSIRCVADEKGEITDYFGYSPFGVPQQKIERGDLQPAFTGLFFDPQASVYLTRARAYDPQLGRFLQTDPQHRVPTGSQKDFSAYAYCGGDPINFVDLTGGVPEPVNPYTWEPISFPSGSISYHYEPQGVLSFASSFAQAEVLDRMIPMLPETFQDLYTLRGQFQDATDLSTITSFDDMLEFPFHAAAFMSTGTAASSLFAPLWTAVQLHGAAYKDLRAAIDQRRSMNLVRLPLGVSEQMRARSTGRISRDYGRFAMTGSKSFRASGGWSRLDQLSRSATSMRANWKFKDVHLHTGARLSGDFYRRETRSVAGDKYTRKSVGKSSYRVSYNGAAISKAVEEYNKTGVYDPAKWENKLREAEPAPSVASLPGKDVSTAAKNLLITDRGINQYNRKDHRFAFEDHIVFKLPSADPKDPSYGKTHEMVKREAWAAVKGYMQKHPDAQNLELRVLQDVNTIGYATGKLPWSKAQERADRFTEAFLEGVNQAKSELGLNVSVLAGSNAGRTFTHGIVSQHKKGNQPVDKITYDDAQVGRDKVAEVIETLGADNVTFFCVRGGTHGSLENWGVPTKRGTPGVWYSRDELAANPRVAKDMCKEYQGVRMYYFNPPGPFDRPLGLGPGDGRHIYPSEHSTEKIQCREYHASTNSYGEYSPTRPLSIIEKQFRQLNLSRGNAMQEASVFPTQRIETQHPKKKQPETKRRREDKDSDKLVSWGGGPDGGGGGGGGFGGGFFGGGFFPMSPSNVGGIYLRGAGEALKHLGPLKGIAIDENNGRLVLLSEGESKIELPPLRMDDVVTVFRSVYEHGEAPLVSIDPNPKDPEGPFMLVRHGKETPSTYAGWILFEADRVMKAYSLGFDNVTREQLDSKVEGYQNLFDMGFSNFDAQQKAPIWERFWIVPAEVNRRQTNNRELTLFDVPLKVNTQRMVLRDGKLEPAPGEEPSKPAKDFSAWFTKAYDTISAEALSKPPKGTDSESPIPVFSELRRIALVTAIAETLHGQGVPMPSWMRDYPVKPCDVPVATPSIVVEATKTETKRVREGSSIRMLKSAQKQRIYGGVNLAPADKDIHVTKRDPEAEQLAPVVSKQIASLPMLASFTFENNGKQIQAVALPGDNTLDLGANQLTETDLVVPVQRGTQIALMRKFNSFFQPKGALGNGWTFDLPQLVKQHIPVKRTGDKAEYKTVYQLTSPLNTYSESFRKHKFVQEMNGKLIVPERSEIFLGLADANRKKIGFPTTELIFRDGRQWHFDESGDLVAQVENPLTIVYRRDGAKLIRRIEGWYGDKLRADIRIEYDEKSRVESARGSNKVEAKYAYDSSSELNRVKFIDHNTNGQAVQNQGTEDAAEYEYKDGLVAAITWNGEKVRQFGYGDRGQLVWERFGDGEKRNYQVSSSPEGMKITASTNSGATSAEYDAAFRPLKRVLEDGTHIQWKYNADDHIEVEVFQPIGDRYRANYSADGKHVTWHLPEGDSFSAEYDAAGRFTALRRGDREILRQEWHANGLPASTVQETAALHPQYSEDDVLTSVLVTPPQKGTQFSKWQKTEYDELGRPHKVTDYSGSEIQIGYDKTGQPGIVVSKLGGIKVDRDNEGRVRTVDTSWRDGQENKYDSNTGMLSEVTLTRGKNKASIELDQGRPTTVKQFDGGKLEISYHYPDTHGGKVKQITCPNDVVLKYTYDSADRLSSVNCDGTYELKLAYDAQDRLVELDQVPVSQ
jgi:RHS repeat-associated protein